MQRAQQAKAEAFLAEAESKLSKKSSWLSSFTSSTSKYEEAAELFSKAGNAFKVASLFTEAGQAYYKAYEVFQQNLKEMNDATRALMDAAQCFKKSINPSDAIQPYQDVIVLLCDAGRISQAAKQSKELGELFEASNCVKEAIHAYEQAAEFFHMEDSKSHAGSCLVKVAELSSAALDPPDFIKAARLYEDMGKNCLDSNLLKYNAKGYFLQCLLCHLANSDAIAAQQNYDTFASLDFTFATSREGKFAIDCVQAVNSFDSDAFATLCFEFDRITKLDAWKTSILFKIKSSIGGGITDDCDGLDGISGDDDLDLT